MYHIFQGGLGALPQKIFEYLECGRSHLTHFYHYMFLGLFFTFLFHINQFSLFIFFIYLFFFFGYS